MMSLILNALYNLHKLKEAQNSMDISVNASLVCWTYDELKSLSSFDNTNEIGGMLDQLTQTLSSYLKTNNPLHAEKIKNLTERLQKSFLSVWTGKVDERNLDNELLVYLKQLSLQRERH